MIKTTVTGDCTLYANEYNGKTFYKTSLIHKKNGEWEYGPTTIEFRKGVTIPNKTKIIITDGWVDFYLDKDGKTVHKIFCNAFECESQDMPQKLSKPAKDKKPPEIPEGFQALEDDDDIPF